MGIPTVSVVFTVLHAGGKFGGSGYKVSGGLHGVGASVVNALSTWLEVEVRDGKHRYAQRYETGTPVDELHIVGDTDITGTVVTFKPDPNIFTDTTVFDYDTLLTRLREQAFLNAGVKITLSDARSNRARSREASRCIMRRGNSCSYRGAHHVPTPSAPRCTRTPIYLAVQRENKHSAEVALSHHTDGYDTETILSFANNIHTVGGRYA